MTREPGGLRAEAYRSVRSNLEFVAMTEGASALVVTSPRQGQGKTTTAVNLALAIAEQRKRVVLVDADLRRPSVAEVARLESSVGLTTVLVGQASIDDVVQKWASTSLDVITSGKLPPNPLQLVDSQGMFDLLNELRARYDVVVVDSPPLLSVADAAVLSQHVDGAVLTVTAGRTNRNELSRALETLSVARGHLIGVILTRARAGRHDRAYGPRRRALGRRGQARDSSPTTGAPRGAAVAPAQVGASRHRDGH
jgi:succinoglycan biosynthesis transport protein ExoP